MALHDYRQAIDIYGGDLIAVEITTDNKIALVLYHPMDGVTHSLASTLDTPTAGILLDAIAGAIRELEGLVPPALEQATRDAYAGGEQPTE